MTLSPRLVPMPAWFAKAASQELRVILHPFAKDCAER